MTVHAEVTCCMCIACCLLDHGTHILVGVALAQNGSSNTLACRGAASHALPRVACGCEDAPPRLEVVEGVLPKEAQGVDGVVHLQQPDSMIGSLGSMLCSLNPMWQLHMLDGAA